MSTFVGKKIEAATRAELESEDWALNMEICDIINENDDDAKDAARAIKKRLQQIEQDRNFTVTDRTLTVLETCVSNCSHRFHVLVMTKDFILDLVKLIGPKNNPPIELQERVLSLIERWAEAFRPHTDLNGVWSVYQDLKAKGVTFPRRDPSSHVPIQTPQRTVPAAAPSQQLVVDRSSANHLVDPQQHPHQQRVQHQPAGQVILEGEGYNKITQDLTIVQSSIEMMQDVMKILESPEAEESDWKLVGDLNTTCRQMKERIVELIERVANEDLTIELLRLNDELNNLFIKYDRIVKNKAKMATTPKSAGTSVATTSSRPDASGQTSRTIHDDQQTGASSTTSGQKAPKLPGVSSQTLSDLSLLDFNAMSSADKAAAVANKAKQESTGTAAPSSTTSADPFDTSNILPVLTTSGTKTAAATSSNTLSQGIADLSLGTARPNVGLTASTDKKTAGLPEEISSVREQDFAEIENWLSTDSDKNLNSIAGDPPSMDPISVPNSEFENFIASRALAGLTATTATDSSKTEPKQRPEPSS